MGEAPKKKGIDRRSLLGGFAASAVVPLPSGAESAEQVAMRVEETFPKSAYTFVKNLGEWFSKHQEFPPHKPENLEKIAELDNVLTWYLYAFCEERKINIRDVHDINSAIRAQALGYASAWAMKSRSDERAQDFLFTQWNKQMAAAVEHSLHPERSELRRSLDPNEREA